MKQSPFICACRLDGNVGGQSLSVDEAKRAWADRGTGFFLPLGFVTGLPGINEDLAAFWIVCVLLVGLGIGAWLLFRIKKWL
ncbi:MAG: hypothetical protein R8L07_19560 [Alphaproteobacteria bacterium]|nr:hypothetical protein [Alphaproteobacteria bacterium]